MMDENEAVYIDESLLTVRIEVDSEQNEACADEAENVTSITNSFSCTKCDFTTYRKHNLERHAKTHSREFLHCEKCKFKTVFKGRLEQHKRTCAVKLASVVYLSCNVCDYGTTDKSDLKKHQLNPL